MMDVGRLCVKTAGRDLGKKCVIVDTVDEKFVMIDGETRRRKCNMKHLEPLEETINIKKGASHSEVAAEFKKMGIELREAKPRKPKPKQKKMRAGERKKMAPKEDLKKPKKESAPKPQKSEPAKAETKLEKAISAEGGEKKA